jgi:Family of unknown function (DUF6221)
MDDLITFLRARLDEDEAWARSAAEFNATEWDNPSTGVVSTGADGLDGLLATSDRGLAGHIARHDPARVLAEVDAKRRIIDLHHTKVFETVHGSPEFGHDFWCEVCHVPSDQRGRTWCLTLRLLALPYADHPDYREDWRP